MEGEALGRGSARGVKQLKHKQLTRDNNWDRLYRSFTSTQCIIAQHLATTRLSPNVQLLQHDTNLYLQVEDLLPDTNGETLVCIPHIPAAVPSDVCPTIPPYIQQKQRGCFKDNGIQPTSTCTPLRPALVSLQLLLIYSLTNQMTWSISFLPTLFQLHLMTLVSSQIRSLPLHCICIALVVIAFSNCSNSILLHVR